jgi:catalase
MPQASAAHDTFWDFISLMPESAHMIMWVLSDRALPRSYRMMEGFGVHTFRWINEAGHARFIKWHWRPTLGTASLVWDETQKIAGKDPDFNRRDLWEAIEMGDYPEFELCVQMIEEKDEHSFDFDILDATKIWPEELVPLKKVGRMVLNRNPDNFFAETEQVAFHPGHVVPGIDFTNDPLLQGRLFSYVDTQLIRLGGPNFAEIPINRPLAPVHNNQRDGFMRQTINRGRVAYFPNSLAKGCPMMAPESAGGYVHYMEKVDGAKVRNRSDKFRDFFSQATMFWHSITPGEQQRLVDAAHFELSKVETIEIRERMVNEFFNNIDHDLATRVAEGIGVAAPLKKDIPKPKVLVPEVGVEHQKKPSPKTRKIAILAADGVDAAALMQVKDAIMQAGAMVHVVSKLLGELKPAQGEPVKVDKNYVTAASVMYDAVLVAGGADSAAALKRHGDAIHWINETFKHCKTVGAFGEGVEVLQAAQLGNVRVAGDDGLTSDSGVITSRSADGDFAQAFLDAVAEYRHWDRQEKDMVPA